MRETNMRQDIVVSSQMIETTTLTPPSGSRSSTFRQQDLVISSEFAIGREVWVAKFSDTRDVSPGYTSCVTGTHRESDASEVARHFFIAVATVERWVWQRAVASHSSELTAAARSLYIYGQRHRTLQSRPAVGDAVVFGWRGPGLVTRRTGRRYFRIYTSNATRWQARTIAFYGMSRTRRTENAP
jgi:hypothetical protein